MRGGGFLTGHFSIFGRGDCAFDGDFPLENKSQHI